MSTGSDVVSDAMYACGALGSDGPISAADSTLVLRRLNRMLDSWNLVRQNTFETFFDTFSTVIGTQSYSTSLLTQRPIEVEEMYLTLNNVNYPVALITDEQWANIPYRQVTALPRDCWIDTGYPNSTFYFYPIPDQVYTVNVGMRRPLTTAITLATTLSFPPGYEAALVANLAVDIAGSFGRPVTPQMQIDAATTVKRMQAVNYVPGLLDADLHTEPRYSIADFYRGV